MSEAHYSSNPAVLCAKIVNATIHTCT